MFEKIWFFEERTQKWFLYGIAVKTPYEETPLRKVMQKKKLKSIDVSTLTGISPLDKPDEAVRENKTKGRLLNLLF